MNPSLPSILSLLSIVATLPAAAQSPAAAPPVAANQIVETSRIARFLAGPGDRPQGFLLKNGTFVTLSPGLAQQLPATMKKNETIQVAGDALSYNGNKTIEARSVTVAGVGYLEANPVAGPPAAQGMAAPAPPPPAPGAPPSPRAPRPGLAAAPPPPPVACGPGAPPPPPPPIAGGPVAPPPAAPGNVPPPPPPQN